MDTLATIARHRRVIATIADMIMTAAGDGNLRVVVDGGYPDDATFADHLTQALHARGRTCRCLLPRPDTDPAGDRTARPTDTAAPTAAAVIIDGRSGLQDGSPCQVRIRVLGPAQHPAPAVGPDQSDGDTPGDDLRPHIVVDYLDPAGPTIRHIDPPNTGVIR